MIKIVILQRGWVVVGNYQTDGVFSWIDDGAVVRRWGTSRGLGELAYKGPLENTVLDPVMKMKWHIMTEVATMEVREESWEKASKEWILNPEEM